VVGLYLWVWSLVSRLMSGHSGWTIPLESGIKTNVRLMSGHSGWTIPLESGIKTNVSCSGLLFGLDFTCVYVIA